MTACISYAFSKAIESVYKASEAQGDADVECDIDAKLEAAAKYGRQFQRDFVIKCNHLEDEEYEKELIEAVRFVSLMGAYCAEGLYVR